MKELALKAAAIAGLLVLACFLLGAGPFQQRYEIAYVVGYRVGSGDTLWGIANKFYGLQDKSDIREFIFDIREYSGVSPVIHAGQLIEIPIYKKVN